MLPPMQDNQILKFTVSDDGERIDAFLTRCLEESTDIAISRSRIQKLITDGLVRVNGKNQKKNFTLSSGEIVEIEIPPAEPDVVEPDEEIKFDILHEDDDLIIVNKPAGVVTHPTEHSSKGSLINGLLGRGVKLAEAGGRYRPGVVHRIDRETSGILLFAKSDRAYYKLVEIFKSRQIEKFYRAIVIGNMRDLKGEFNLKIGRHPKIRTKMAVVQKGGREALTHYEVIERFEGFDSLRLQIFTGRTHQIRVHLAHSGRSILNDSIYSKKDIVEHIRHLGSKGYSAVKLGKLMTDLRTVVMEYPGMFLHSERLIFVHPFTQNKLDITAHIPQAFETVCSILRDSAEQE
jgi:23S rRNA pseudouridine1911/1915/1917 synthase